MEETYNAQLYMRLLAEQAGFKNWLMQQTPEEILNHAYEYVTREDILIAASFNNLTVEQAKAMLKSPTPLADVFAKWESWETNYMENIWEAVTSRADDMIKMQRVRDRNTER